MAAIAPASTAELLELLRKSNVLSAARLKALPDADALPDDPRKGATVLVQKGFITKFQGTQLLAGRHKGFRIGPYAVLDLLGRGGMGAVYLGEHLELNRKVAIKVLGAVKGEGHQLAAERFLREARAAAALDHPNIVRVFDVARYNDTPYLVMEYVDGETLQQALDRDGAVPPEAAAEHIAQAAAGLQHAHERGFIHRDIKPANLILDRSGVVKVLDMGLARSGSAEDKLTELLDEGAVVGTADFISPEQAMNSPHVDGRADIYSLGATLFTLLVGKTPFEGNTTQKLMQHQLKAPPSLTGLNRGIPAGLAGVAAKMLAKKPADRYQSAAEVVDALAPWAGASTHVAAGMSRTSLGQTATLRARAGLSSGAMKRAAEYAADYAESDTEPDDTDVTDPPHPDGETREVGTDATVRKRAAVPPAARPRRLALFAALALLLLAAAGVGGWLAFGRNDEPKVASNKPAEPPPPQQQPPPPKEKDKPPFAVVPPVVPPKMPGERVLYTLDLSGVKPFNIRSVNTVDANDPTKKVAKVLARTGPGMPPAGWQARSYGKEAEMEFFADTFEGSPALGIRNTGEMPSAMMFAPTLASTAHGWRLKIEYQSTARRGHFTVRFRPDDTRRAWDVAWPSPTKDGWKVGEFVADLKDAKGGLFEFHNSDDAPGAVVRLRSVVISELPAGTPLPPPPVKPSGGNTSAGGTPDYKGWTEGKSVYALDTAKIPPFRVTKEQNVRTAGEAEKLPPGIVGHAWRDGAIGEFRRDTFEGTPALGLTNLNDAKSAQFYFDLDGGMKLALRPGQAYRVKVGYRSAAAAAGTALVQLTPGYKNIATTPLGPSPDQWKTAAVTFVRPPAADNVKMRFAVENTTVGEGNTLWVRSVEVVELNPPKK